MVVREAPIEFVQGFVHAALSHRLQTAHTASCTHGATHLQRVHVRTKCFDVVSDTDQLGLAYVRNARVDLMEFELQRLPELFRIRAVLQVDGANVCALISQLVLNHLRDLTLHRTAILLGLSFQRDQS